MSIAKPTLQAPLTGQALRQCVASHRTAEWTAYAQSLRIAGYRVEPARLADQLLRHGCASVQDAFGQEVLVQVRVPQPVGAGGAAAQMLPGAGPPEGDEAPAGLRSFQIAC
jgi:hypothetical protein